MWAFNAMVKIQFKMPASRIAMLRSSLSSNSNPASLQCTLWERTNDDSRTYVPATYMETWIHFRFWALAYSIPNCCSHLESESSNGKRDLVPISAYVLTKWTPWLNSCDHKSCCGTIFCWRNKDVENDNMKSDGSNTHNRLNTDRTHPCPHSAPRSLLLPPPATATVQQT